MSGAEHDTGFRLTCAAPAAWRRIVFGLVLLALPVPPSAAEDVPPLDPRAEALAQGIKATLRPGQDQSDPKTGPWAPYLKPSYASALSPRERALYKRALRNGDCDTVTALQAAGFLLLHPYLEPVHARVGVGRIFLKTVIEKLPDYRYCLARGSLRMALRFFETNRLELPLIRADYLRRGAAKTQSTDTPQNRATNELCDALSLLAKLALRERHRLAIGDIGRFIHDPRIVQLSGKQEFYLYELAVELGLDLPDLKTRRAAAHHKVKPSKRTTLRHYAKTGKGFVYMDGGWTCSWPRMTSNWRKAMRAAQTSPPLKPK